uniref:AlNc14C19G2019 protein n=1 Tax=Albugo laibachii Nc14 TaxID=890382 RepID=F0W548_9STRA|nr:AlNc14C19G2019 [Albugo laibachii Nc14]|eukprot:CCA16239.1 AlNc14C19G2019 [Albugo laibachii Nc14]
MLTTAHPSECAMFVYRLDSERKKGDKPMSVHYSMSNHHRDDSSSEPLHQLLYFLLVHYAFRFFTADHKPIALIVMWACLQNTRQVHFRTSPKSAEESQRVGSLEIRFFRK